MTTIDQAKSSEQLFRLDELEQIIGHSQQAFYHIGNALQIIRKEQLYLNEYTDFDTYCRQRWEMSRRKADYLIKAAITFDNLRQNNCSQLPVNEAQIRPLTNLSPQEQVELWQQVINLAPQGQITAKLVKEIIAIHTQQTAKTDENLILESQLIKYTQKLGDYLIQIEQILNVESDYTQISGLSGFVNELAVVESKVAQLRKTSVSYLLSQSQGCCPSCNQQMIQLMESCHFCGWNTGVLNVNK